MIIAINQAALLIGPVTISEVLVMRTMRMKSSNRPFLRFLASIKIQTALILCAVSLGILLANTKGHGYVQESPANGKILLKAVSWKLVKKLAEPDAGLRGHRVMIINPADESVIASRTTDRAGLVEFELAPGTYTLLGASDEPETVTVRPGQTAKFKLIVH
jgi:hypothetical protein